MQKDVEENYIHAGKIAAEMKEETRRIVKVGEPLLKIAEMLERMIHEKGGEPAFPINISINDIAAHYTPTKIDNTIVKDNDIIKIDLGVHIDGYVADTAVTINFNNDYKDLVDAAELALGEAIKEVRPDALLSSISSTIEETISSKGFKPVNNLTGHGLNRYDLHTEPTVPNISFRSDYKLKEDQVIAIEPFATDGAGFVKDSEDVFIFMVVDNKPVRGAEARKIIEFSKQFNGLPFAERWIPLDSLFKIRMALKELRMRGNIHDFHVLKEARKGMVSQAEHTLIVRDPPLILTQ